MRGWCEGFRARQARTSATGRHFLDGQARPGTIRISSDGQAAFGRHGDEILELAVGAERKTTKSLGRMGVRNEGGGWRLFLLQRRLDER